MAIPRGGCFKNIRSLADKIDSAKRILDKLNETNEIYFSFLKYILGIINKINRVFQSETAQIHILYEQMESLFKTVVTNFLKPEAIKCDKIILIDFINPKNFLENDIYLGIFAQELLSKSKLNESKKKEITKNCTNFYIELCKQIFKRFSFENNFKNLSLLNPDSIMTQKNNSILDLVNEFPHFINQNEKQELDSEFRELTFLNLKEHFKNLDINLNTFWKNISEIKRGSSSCGFPILTKFVQKIMTLPHSSANVERIFSQVNLNKTKIRNSLKNETLEGILYAKDYLKMNSSNCFDVIIAPELLKLMNCNIYQGNRNE